MPDYFPTQVNLIGNTFTHPGPLALVTNSVAGKQVTLRTAHSTGLGDGFTAAVGPGPGAITVESDLPGLAGD